MKKIGALIIVFTFAMSAFAQLPNKVEKMAGTWVYKLHSGYEVLEIVDGELRGEGYRIHRKTSDTSRVENVRIRMANKNLIYTMTTYNFVEDSVLSTVNEFVGQGRKLKFQNISAPTPYAIHYSFGFLNRNKMFIKIYHGPEAKPVKLILTREKED
jgi:hypothetical protein